ncbi:HAD family hydrolase [Alloalcanivorax mobilis]|uniref:HAD family hydrolase n=1 Tax=Alloalcanivorax mobilis TaxID=2019569 RepID=UPI000C784679|nr:HAD family hydrolase [Alloalcanivorax mobilis]
MSRYDAVVFDLDGTLVDSNLDFAALRRELGFPEGEGVLEHLATLSDPRRIERSRTIIDRHEMQGAASATWIDGAQALLERLHDHAVPTAILTRNSRAAVARTRATLGLSVELILTREDCAAKPDPDGLLRITRTLALVPSRTLYVGDFIYDLQAARNAGMVAVLYCNGRNQRFAADADLVVDRLETLLDWVVTPPG